MSKLQLTVCDFDGSVSPYVPDPEQAIFHEEFLPFLEEYTEQSSSSRFIFLSGRPPSFIAQQVPEHLRWQIGYVGHYGLSTATSSSWLILDEEAKPFLDLSQKLKDELEALLSDYTDVVEHTGIGAVVHFRWVDEDIASRICALVNNYRATSDLANMFHAEVTGGNISFNPGIRHDKGLSLRRIVDQIGIGNIDQLNYIGDDIPDIPAFRTAEELRTAHGISGTNYVVLRPGGLFSDFTDFPAPGDCVVDEIDGAIVALRKDLIVSQRQTSRTFFS